MPDTPHADNGSPQSAAPARQRELVTLSALPEPSPQSHFGCITRDGPKRLYDRLVHESLKHGDVIPVTYTETSEWAVPCDDAGVLAERMQQYQHWLRSQRSRP